MPLTNFSIIESIGLGISLAMDAFSVCVANGLKEPNMTRARHMKMAGIYSFFQFAMPMIGWLCVHTIATIFTQFTKFIPWIALILLVYIGGHMLIEGFRSKEGYSGQSLDADSHEIAVRITTGTLIIQGIATSIDALSVGFAIAGSNVLEAFLSSLVIAVVTFLICMFGVRLGRMFGSRLEKYANYLGGTILIAIGIKIFFAG